MTNANRPPELQAIIDLLQRGEPFASEEAQRAVDAQMRMSQEAKRDTSRYEVEYRRTPLYSRFVRFEFHRP